MRRHEGESARQTRIVATVGRCPAGEAWPAYLDRLVAAGVDVLRLNLSHVSEGYCAEQEVLEWANRPIVDRTAPAVAVLADMQGPKARIMAPPGDGVVLVEGTLISLAPPGHAPETAEQQVAERLEVSEATGGAIVRSLAGLLANQPGLQPLLLLGDGDWVLRVLSHDSRGLVAAVEAGGQLSGRKGVTLRGVDIDLDPFPAKDQADLRFCLKQGVDFVAISFVRSAADVQRVRAFIDSELPVGAERVPLIAKIETLSATEAIDDILDAADGVMIARGDLGLQLGLSEVPLMQKMLALKARERGKPAIVATQMLESMIHNPAPTRAEATDVFNAVLDGGDAVMLSAETSVGSRPCLAVQTIDELARAAERYRADPEHIKRDRKAMRRHARARASDPYIGRINEEFALTAVQFGEHIPARAVVSATRSGGTPRRQSRYRPAIPLLAVCNNDRVARSLLLCYGVHPIVLRDYAANLEGRSLLVELARETLRRDYGLCGGDAIVLTAGIDWPRGGTNSLRVLVEDLEGKNKRFSATVSI